jgi:hypothetical protein
VNPFFRNWLEFKRNSGEARIKPANPAWGNLAERRTQGEQYLPIFWRESPCFCYVTESELRGYTSAGLASKRVRRIWSEVVLLVTRARYSRRREAAKIKSAISLG